MLDDQIYLIACVLAARADVTNLKEALSSVDDPKLVSDAICVLWPELGDLSALEFPLTISRSKALNCDDILVSLLQKDERLICIAEMDNDTIRKRCESTKDYVSSRLMGIEENSRFRLDDPRSQWLRNRMILCDDMRPENTMIYKKLWQNHMQEEIQFAKWVEGIIEPLIHLNNTTGHYIKIRDFEKMCDLDVFKLMFNGENRPQTSTVITKEVIPYLKHNKGYATFLNNIFTIGTFSLDSYENYNLFKQLFVELNSSLPSSFRQEMQKKSLIIIFENSANLLKVCNLDAMLNIVQHIDDDIQVGDYYDLTARTLRSYLKYMNTCLFGYDLKRIYAITKEEEGAQSAHFASIIKDLISKMRSNPQYLGFIFDLMSTSSTNEENIFIHLTRDKQTLILIETALELGDFDLLHQFITKYDSVIEEDSLLKYFWYFFNNASNGLSTRPEIIKARKTLDLLLQTDHSKYVHLKVLLQVANQISQYSLNLGKGIPFKPSDILKYRSKPFELISLLLELNNHLYNDSFTITTLLKNLKIALKIHDEGNEKLTSEEQAKLLSLQIDHALVNTDFVFAVRNTKELLQFDNITQHWATIFQVGKFMDPNWKDDEIPTDILILQLEVLGELLHVCPIEEIEAVTSHWSVLELELMTRDMIHDT